jgi:hypothetical protein
VTAIAEIPTREAAEAFAEYARRFPEFETLFARIDAAGYPLGVEGRLRAFAVLSRLNALSVTLADARDLADYLVPVLAASTHERRRQTRRARQPPARRSSSVRRPRRRARSRGPISPAPSSPPGSAGSRSPRWWRSSSTCC